VIPLLVTSAAVHLDLLTDLLFWRPWHTTAPSSTPLPLLPLVPATRFTIPPGATSTDELQSWGLAHLYDRRSYLVGKKMLDPWHVFINIGGTTTGNASLR
jgi:hypothetical protein